MIASIYVRKSTEQNGVTEKEKAAVKRRALESMAQTVADVVGISS